MESVKLLAVLLLSMVVLSTATAPITACSYCDHPPKGKTPPTKPPKHKTPTGKPVKPPTTNPPVTYPPGTGGPIIGGPGVLPPIIGGPGVTLPPGGGVTLPPGGGVTLPPGGGVTLPPGGGVTLPPGGGSANCPPGTPSTTPPVVTPPPAPTCPANSLKIGACVDVLGGLVHGVVGDPAVNKCCPVLGGLLELEAAVCLCTGIRLKLLSLNIYLPLALKLLVTCGKNPPPGFTCPPS